MIDERLGQPDEQAACGTISRPPADLTLVERVHEMVRVYEECLAYKHCGKRIQASRTRQAIKRWGEKEAARRAVMNRTTSPGLGLLAKYGRLAWTYEQIILDFPGEFDAVVIGKAREILASLSKGS